MWETNRYDSLGSSDRPGGRLASLLWDKSNVVKEENKDKLLLLSLFRLLFDMFRDCNEEHFCKMMGMSMNWF